MSQEQILERVDRLYEGLRRNIKRGDHRNSPYYDAKTHEIFVAEDGHQYRISLHVDDMTARGNREKEMAAKNPHYYDGFEEGVPYFWQRRR